MLAAAATGKPSVASSATRAVSTAPALPPFIVDETFICAVSPIFAAEGKGGVSEE